MSGLLTKDLYLVLQRKQGVLMFLAIAVLMSFSMDGSFTFGYTMFFLMILAVGTISYDEFDNGYCFLMTLPITRKLYVAEKYVFCILTALTGWFFSLILCAVVGAIRQVELVSAEMLGSLVAMFPVALILMSLMVPIQLKYGAEKSRGVLIVVMALFGMAMLGLGKVFHALGIDMDETWQKFERVSDMQMLCIFFLAAIGCCFLSGLISVHIMNRKEF